MINNEEVENTSITAPSLIDFFTESSIDETILCEDSTIIDHFGWGNELHLLTQRTHDESSES
ncbi:unnamed protein product [Cuscuta epithymum]|uniref:Uncharacterized protein n=1 Tax=Cuscuta epithymum TaxID=186058 RepID=A0AAV0D8W4_9ASTE|nr:unnamed protein product [Cuscuta epithymum]